MFDFNNLCIVGGGLFAMVLFFIWLRRRTVIETDVPPPLAPPRSSIGSNNRQPAIHPMVLDEIKGLLAKGNKIEAIRRVRETTGQGLVEAKDYVERLDDSGQISRSSTPVPKQTREPMAGNLSLSGGAQRQPSQTPDWLTSLQDQAPNTFLGRIGAFVNLAAIQPQVIDLLRKGQRLEAIKLVHEKTGLGLKESKEMVEQIASGLGKYSG